MVFLYPQTKHPLIPQAHDLDADLAIASKTKNFRQEFFVLLKNKIAELTANFPKLVKFQPNIFSRSSF